jgi:hypothetical protein
LAVNERPCWQQKAHDAAQVVVMGWLHEVCGSAVRQAAVHRHEILGLGCKSSAPVVQL